MRKKWFKKRKTFTYKYVLELNYATINRLVTQVVKIVVS
jgi:hypothetical protein